MNNYQSAKAAKTHLRSLANSAIAEHSQRFFKTGPGEYGEGDQFLGIRVPILRAESRRFSQMPLEQVLTLLKTAFHEERLFALLLLVRGFERGSLETRKIIYEAYLGNTSYINNWDLVDCSAHKIVGEYLRGKSRKPLYTLARSGNLWERRIAVIATLRFIKNDDYVDTLKISKLLLNDDEDLIHKAVGWMLREVGNRDRSVEESFLREHYHEMPRTMLRYAIEKFPQAQRQQYMKGSL